MKNKFKAVVTSCLPLINSCGLQDSKNALDSFCNTVLNRQTQKKKAWLDSQQPSQNNSEIACIAEFVGKVGSLEFSFQAIDVCFRGREVLVVCIIIIPNPFLYLGF
jgi:hypothetical protein